MLLKSRKIFARFTVILLFGIVAISCATTSPPLPEVMNIIPPSQNLSPELAAFSGSWKGTMSNGIEIILVVEKIDAQKADVIISFAPTYEFKGFYQYHEAEILDDSSIRIAATLDRTITFKMNKDLNSLSAVLQDKPVWSEGKFKRINN